MDTKVETKVAQTAFYWLGYGRYGSEAEALHALLRRKGIESLDRESAQRHLGAAVNVFKRTNELRFAIAKEYRKADVPYLTKRQFDEGSARLKATLEEEFPSLLPTVEYMIGMVWDMPYWR